MCFLFDTLFLMDLNDHIEMNDNTIKYEQIHSLNKFSKTTKCSFFLAVLFIEGNSIHYIDDKEYLIKTKSGLFFISEISSLLGNRSKYSCSQIDNYSYLIKSLLKMRYPNSFFFRKCLNDFKLSKPYSSAKL